MRTHEDLGMLLRLVKIPTPVRSRIVLTDVEERLRKGSLESSAGTKPEKVPTQGEASLSSRAVVRGSNFSH